MNEKLSTALTKKSFLGAFNVKILLETHAGQLFSQTIPRIHETPLLYNILSIYSTDIKHSLTTVISKFYKVNPY